MGNYILDFVDKELLAHRKRKEKVSQQESSYILQATIKKQEEILVKEKKESNIESVEDKEIISEEDKRKKELKTDEIGEGEEETKKELSEMEKEKDIIKREVSDKQVSNNNSSLEELSEEKTIPLQQKDKDSIVSKEIMNILEGTNIEQSILSFNEEDEDMNVISSNEKELNIKTKEKKAPKKKSKMKTILFQAIVGFVLIVISVLYLVDSPAEQKVLKSGMSIWIDKIKMFLGNSNDYLHDRFLTDLEENRKDLILDIDNKLEIFKECNLSGTDLKKDIEQLEGLRNAIKNMSLERYKQDHMSIEMQVKSIENGEIIKNCYETK